MPILNPMSTLLFKAHPGFQKVASHIAAKEGISHERASAILAASTRRASPSAKKHNPRLQRVRT